MSTSTKRGDSKKRQSRPKDPTGPDRAVINQKEEEFHNLCQRFRFPSEWGAQFPTVGNTALNAPPMYMTLYVAFFRKGNRCRSSLERSLPDMRCTSLKSTRSFCLV
ncbi:hypothetical protein Hanom_Chr02g00103921 [Helianthus anomalus]